MVEDGQDDLATAMTKALLKLHHAYDGGRGLRLESIEVAALVNLLRAEIDDLTVAR